MCVCVSLLGLCVLDLAFNDVNGCQSLTCKVKLQVHIRESTFRISPFCQYVGNYNLKPLTALTHCCFPAKGWQISAERRQFDSCLHQVLS